MSRRAGKSDYASIFGQALDQQLARRGMKQSDIARAAKVSPSYVNRLMTGGATPHPEWVDLIAGVMKLPPAEATKLHAAAARAAGYKIKLD